MIEANFTMKPTGDIIKDLGLAEGGRVQQYVDQTFIRYMVPNMPFSSGYLIDSVTNDTVIGSGVVSVGTIYGHYLNEGILYVDSVTGSAWARRGSTKVPTGQKLTFQYSPKRGAHFVERTINDHRDDIIRGAQKVLEDG